MISGTIKTEDYVAALLLHRIRVAVQLRIWLTVAVVAGVIMIFSNAAQGGYLFLIGGVAGLLAEFYFVKVRARRIAKKRLAQYPEFADPVTYSWDKETISATSASGNNRRPWHYYILRKENDAVILLYMTDGLFQMVPKRWFADDQQLNEFREYAKVIRS